jgi:hypothetical protein
MRRDVRGAALALATMVLLASGWPAVAAEPSTTGSPAGPQAGGAPPDGDRLPCLDIPVTSWTDGARPVALPAPLIPYGPWRELGERLMVLSRALPGGPADRATAERSARDARAGFVPHSPADQTYPRWVVVELEGALHAFEAWLFDAVVVTGHSWVGDTLVPRFEVNPVVERLCGLPASSDRHRLVSAHTKAWAPDRSPPSLVVDWTVEAGTVIRDGATGEVIASGGTPSDEPAPDVPFEAGPEASEWLRSNAEGRAVGVDCEIARPDATWGPGAIASVRCGPDGRIGGSLVLTLYESPGTLDAYVESVRETALGDGRRLGDIDRCGPDWHLADDAFDLKGAILCWQHPDGSWYVQWTERAWRVAAWLGGSAATLEAILPVWQRVVRAP